MTPNEVTLALPALPDVLDVADLAALLRIHPVTVRLKAASGEIPFGRQIGNRWRFSRARIEAWLAEDKDDDKAA
jgi:excisionase family DNA binding protein